MTKPIKDSRKPLQEPSWWSKYWFYTVLILLAVIGVPSAFFIPPHIPGLTNDGNTVVSVRQGILAVLAGALTMLTLSETHRKNTHEKNKNDRDHTRQVHAERRSRYTAAVEQLANEKAAVRLGGIYTLVGLVDEWLTDDTLNPKERQKEGQVIINNLCSYIRSPFTLALKAEMFEGDSEPDNYEGDFSKDQAAFHEEQDVRRTIFVEMSKRSSTFPKNDKGEIIETVPGIWSDFDFNFSRAPIFYPLNRLTIEKGNFSSAKFYSNADFSGAAFTQTANFRMATFTQNANFIEAAFTQTADFYGAAFTQTAGFSWAKFTKHASFSGATFTKYVYFLQARFTQDANFCEATFTQNAYFNGATFSSSSPKFVETSEVLGMTFRAQFAALTKNQEAHNFTVSEGSFPILLGEAELDGKKYHIPEGTVLFDPTSWDELNATYTRVSAPAK